MGACCSIAWLVQAVHALCPLRDPAGGRRAWFVEHNQGCEFSMATLVNPWKCLVSKRQGSLQPRPLQSRWTNRLFLLGLLVAATPLVGRVQAAEWNPAAWQDESTLDFRTTEAGSGEHWSPVWLVVIDGDVYLRLGTRAADRITKNQTSPFVGIRIAGQHFDKVRAEATPDKADAVAAAMADKYWSDVLVRFFSHPLTMRLVAEPSK